ncbi:MAG: FecR family protein [Dechloromonas sp.]|nr:FecR family protein [Dechloromonas sp.]
MREYNIFRLKNHALLMALAAVYPLTASAAGAARVDFAVGTVNVVAAGGVVRSASKGTELQSGEALVTGEGGRAQLRFSDGGMVSLQPGSEYRIDEYRFSASQNGEEKGFFSLVKGGLRTITGQIGRNDKAAYRVKTNVATIGIRGTEFTVVYTGANSIAVATGEGVIEVCNNAGCAILPSGTSAIVSGPDTRIERSEVRPRLDPAQPEDIRPYVFASSDARQNDGSIAPVSAPLRSGGNYAVAYAYRNESTQAVQATGVSPTSASFTDMSSMQAFIDGTKNFAVGSPVGSFAIDGVLGWGRWNNGTVTDNTTEALTNLHYVAGTPVSLAGLTGIANFNAFGGTNATHKDSGTGIVTVGDVATGTMTVNLTTSTIQNLALNVAINGGNVAINESNIAVTGAGTFNYLSISTVSGFFAGANASFAGLTYSTSGGAAGLTGGNVTGSVVFSR